MLSTLSMRLFVLISVVTLVGFTLLAWVVVEMHTADLEQQTLQGALRLSETLRRTTRSRMLANRKENVYEMMSTVGDQPSIERIRIFNKEGEITYSTHSEERGTVVDKQAESCTRCHVGDSPVSRVEGEELTRIFRAADGHRILGLITPVYNEAVCSGAQCHVLPSEQEVLGVLDLQMSLSGVDQAIESQNRRFLILVYLLLLLIASACGLFVWRFVHLPVRTLIQGTRRIGQGELDYRIQLQSGTEIGRLSASFNAMTEELSRSQQQLQEWARTLEQRVEEKTQSLHQTQLKLIQNEKLASLGSLAAVVAHEINNPLSGVLTYTKLVQKTLTKGTPESIETIQRHLKTMEEETARCGQIVRNLLEFSRQTGFVVGEADINKILDRTLLLIGHKLELQGIRLTKELGSDIPQIVCDADQLKQALLAVLINAVEAMPDGGGLEVRTRLRTDQGETPGVEVEIGDTGVGIPQEVIHRLFEPFFTTKQDKKGVGLGLSVVYGIVHRHQGRIDVSSEMGRGTKVVISLPERAQIEQELTAPETAVAAV